MALFFDLSSMRPAELQRARQAAIRFIASQMTASDVVSIMTFGTALRVISGFTDERGSLIEALRSISFDDTTDRLSKAPLGARTRSAGVYSGRDLAEVDAFYAEHRLGALRSAARSLGAYPGRKALVVFSGGVERAEIENLGQLTATVSAAIQADVSFYPIDARGLVALPPGGDASTASPQGTGILTGIVQQHMRSGFQSSQEMLYSLAADTGGKVLLDSNDLTLGVRQAQEGVTGYYTIGYYSTKSSVGGEYHRVSLRLVDSIQATLDYRHGYYTIPRSSAEKTLQVSPLALSSDSASLSNVGRCVDDRNLKVNGPVLRETVDLIQETTRVFHQSQTLYAYFEVYDPGLDPGSRKPGLVAELDLLSASDKAFTSVPVFVNQLAVCREAVARFDMEVPLATVRPGEYVVQANVMDEVGRMFGFLRSSIVLLP